LGGHAMVRGEQLCWSGTTVRAVHQHTRAGAGGAVRVSIE
jgi:hypothetical protein